MLPKQKITQLVLLGAVAVTAATGGMWLAQEMVQSKITGGPAPADQAQMRDGPLLRLPEPKPIADFDLYDHAGESVSRDALEGEWTLVFFGFTSCPHICPDTLFLLTDVVDRLEGRLPSERLPRVLFVGVDPARDTPEALAQYRERFGGGISAVSGPDEQLRALAMQVGAHYVVPEHEPGTWYNVDHTISVQLLDPQVRWAGVLSAPHDSEAMSDALFRLLGES